MIAICILFADNCRKRNREMKLAPYIRVYLHVMHNIQKQDFQSEYMMLRKGFEVSGASRLKALWPFLDENNLIRARGRLTKASLLMTACHPIILDVNNAAVMLLVQHKHEINCHCGPEQTRNTFMKSYWILRCRAVVKQTIREIEAGMNSRTLTNVPYDINDPLPPTPNHFLPVVHPLTCLLASPLVKRRMFQKVGVQHNKLPLTFGIVS